MSDNKKLRGFALLSKDQLSELAAKGGRKAHALNRAHKFSSEEAKAAGKLGAAARAANRKAKETV